MLLDLHYFDIPNSDACHAFQLTPAGLLRLKILINLFLFHHIVTPLINCKTTDKLASDIIILEGIPNRSPVWMARLAIIIR